MRDAPTDIKLKRAENVLQITWSGTDVRRYGVRALRCGCCCAGCVDERTGVRTLDLDSVPNDIGITNMELVGNYALKFLFSDGHDTGIFSWDRLAGMIEEPPKEFRRYVLEEVRVMGDTMTLVYGGHVFGGIMRKLLDPNGVEDALQPGREVFVRYHTEETGAPGQLAHMIMRHPSTEGWAELYSDGL